MINTDFITSSSDNLKISLAYTTPSSEIRGIVQFSHGMSEHKERYFKFMEFLSDNGYVCVIHDHRGHGKSVKSKDDLGYFYTEDISYIVNDLHDVTSYIKNKFPNKKVYLFSHSMGTLVSRCYIQNYDYEISKLILCGPPTKNPFVGFGIALAYTLKFLGMGKKRSKLLNTLTFGNYSKKKKEKNEWISENSDNISVYNDDELCGFIFTTNGFINLYKLLKTAFIKSLYKISNPELKIFIIAGSDDPVIQSHTHFNDLKDFLHDIGYSNISNKLYPGLRHELLNEKINQEVYDDILHFIEN